LRTLELGDAGYHFGSTFFFVATHLKPDALAALASPGGASAAPPPPPPPRLATRCSAPGSRGSTWPAARRSHARI